MSDQHIPQQNMAYNQYPQQVYVGHVQNSFVPQGQPYPVQNTMGMPQFQQMPTQQHLIKRKYSTDKFAI